MAVNKLLVQPIDAEIKGDKRGEGRWRQGEERKQDYQLTGPGGCELQYSLNMKVENSTHVVSDHRLTERVSHLVNQLLQFLHESLFKT